ncbi:hypothetical protein [Roseovarius salis]|uniref:hypothetical protein n=1 Tax=Roseovarius salis TaxID=3376063 RepID=UPI0037CBB6AA
MTLAMVLRLNALSCLAFGLIFVAAPDAVAGFLGAAPAWVVLLLGIGLLGNALLLWMAVRGRRRPRRKEILFFCAGDLAWVAATLVLTGAGIWITTSAGEAAAPAA